MADVKDRLLGATEAKPSRSKAHLLSDEEVERLEAMQDADRPVPEDEEDRR